MEHDHERTDMPDGFLNFQARPSPYLDRTIERLRHWAHKGLPEDPDQQWLVAEELCHRIVGHDLHPGGGVSTKTIADQLVQQLKRILEHRVITEPVKQMIENTMEWIDFHYQ